MPALENLNKIREGISQEYLRDSNILEELDEDMKIVLSSWDDNCVLIRPKDDEREHFWRVFTDEVNLNTADYILYELIDNEIICFIIELKKTKTETNNTKANKQIKSTFPFVKMIYEKITGENPKDLKTVGIKIFGPPAGKRLAKLSKNEQRRIPDTFSCENLAIGHVVQNKRGAILTSLKNYYKLTNDQINF